MTTLRIATWNLENLPTGSLKDTACREKIADMRADVWIITESPENFELVDLGYKCVATSASASDLPKTKRWVKVFVKLPIESEFNQKVTKDPERTACAQGKLRGGLEIIIYGTVLPWLGDKREKPNAKDQNAFLAALDEQSQEWVALKMGYSSALFIVAGDFNQDLLEKGHFYGSDDRRKALKNALDKAELQYRTGGKYDPIASNAPLNANIDHICVRIPEKQAVESVSTSAWTLVIDGSRISDHFGVYMELLLHQ